MTSSWTQPAWNIASQAPAAQADLGCGSAPGLTLIVQMTGTDAVPGPVACSNTAARWLPGVKRGLGLQSEVKVFAVALLSP